MNAYANAQTAYKESAVLTAPPERLVVMLYDGARRFLFQAVTAMGANDLETSNYKLQRAEAIIDELLATLDMSAGEVAERLQQIYLFSRRELMQARIERNPARVEQVSSLLSELRESWAQIASAAPAAATA
jgi:flagellar secretion chaperone FliS